MADEFEEFKITDYDLENEFNINRPYRKLTKNQQIYGIWADESDDEGGHTGLGSRNHKRKPDYTTPLSFVAGGIQQAGKKKPEDEGKVKKESHGSSSSETEEEEVKVPVQLQRRRRQGMSGGLDKGSMRSIGEWEQHTKGIGKKLLLQMGYQPGKGLGKELQGIATPIEAHKRKGRGAIGAYGEEKKIEPAKVIEQDEEKLISKDSHWRKGDRKAKKIKYVYKTVEEVIESGIGAPVNKDDSSITGVKVIDMTGKEARVLSGYSAIHGTQKKPAEEDLSAEKERRRFDLPELMHNLDLLVDRAEQQIIRLDRRKKNAENRMIALEQEEEKLSERIEEEKKAVSEMQRILTLVDNLEQRSSKGSLDPEEALSMFQEMKDVYEKEYERYQLHQLAGPIVIPTMKEYFKNWNPLSDPKHGVKLMKAWKDLLDDHVSHRGTSASDDPYQQLIWEAWLPPVRSALGNWQVRECEGVLQLLEEWLPLLPNWCLAHTLDQLIMPKIQAEVNAWNPLTDTVPIHAWIHPWLPFMDTRLEVLYPIIRGKLGSALASWHPSDRSAKLILQPWLRAWGKGTTEAFLLRHIVPKLQVVLEEFVINPQQQQLDQWKWVMEWEGFVSSATMSSLLDRCFFPRWLQILVTWLNHQPSFEEVRQWYLGWKRLIPESLMSDPIIQKNLNDALEMMQRAAARLDSIPSTRMFQPPPHPVPPAATHERNLQTLARGVQMHGSVPQGFKELVERRCEEKGILFHPVPGKFYEGKPIYRCGGVQIYIDRSVIFLFQNGVWVPTSLQNCLDMALASSIP